MTDKKNWGKVALSPNPIKTKERIDINGNIIDPRTKQIIVPKEEEYVPPTPPTTIPGAPEQPTTSPIAKDDPMSIQTQIEQAEANLLKLREAKRLKIEELKKQVELLEKQ